MLLVDYHGRKLRADSTTFPDNVDIKASTRDFSTGFKSLEILIADDFVEDFSTIILGIYFFSSFFYF